MIQRVRTRARWAVSRDVIGVAVPTALVVGTVLNAINHGRTIFNNPHEVAWAAVALNYVVPYCVSTWSATAVRARET
jgi:hypothetical protein